MTNKQPLGATMALELITTKLGELAAPLATNLQSKYYEVWGQLMSNSKAQEILGFLNHSSAVVGVLIVDSSSGADSLHIAPSKVHDVSGGRFSGGIAVLNIDTPMTLKGSAIPLGVSLLHEVGHAKQCIENTAWYEDLFGKIMRNKEIVGEGRYNSMKSAHVANDPTVKAVKGGFAAGKPAREAATKAFELEYGNGPTRTLENDNLARHEKPVLVEMGLPYRDDYFNG